MVGAYVKIYRIAFYFPMLAVINLFIYILKDPTLEGVQSDLALLDIAAGHFANIHFLTSAQVSFTFPREIASVANKAVKKARLKNTEPAGKNHPFAHTPETLPADPSEELVSFFDIHFPPILCLAKSLPLFYFALSHRYSM